MKKRTLLTIAVITPSLILVGAGCSSSVTTNDITSTPNATSTTQTGNQVSSTISNFSFQPKTITIKVGDTVTWKNNDSAAHTVTADNGSFDSGSIGRGGTYSRTFTQTGTYPYYCSLHPNMTGTVIVQ